MERMKEMGVYKKVTAKDVAKLANVSQTTVSFILNKVDYASFSEETIQRVYDAAKKLGYRKDMKKKNIKRNKNSKFIVVVCPSLENPYYVNITHAITTRARELGYCTMFFNSLNDHINESCFVDMISCTSASGAILLEAPGLTDTVYQLVNKMPVVLIGDSKENPSSDLVEFNNIKVGHLIAAHLLTLGHKKIAYISRPLKNQQAPRWLRLKGMQQKFAENNIPQDNIMSFSYTKNDEELYQQLSEYETGYYLTEKAVNVDGITAFVGTNDMVALGIMDALHDMKFRIPQDYSVCGCDNTMISKFSVVSLTTIEIFASEKGISATEILVKRIGSSSPHPQNTNESPITTHRLEYEPQLIVRSSTGVNKNSLR